MFFSHSFHSVHKYDTNNNESGFYDVRWLRIGILLHHSEHKWIIHSSTSSVAYVTTNIAVAVMMYDDNKVLVHHYPTKEYPIETGLCRLSEFLWAHM